MAMLNVGIIGAGRIGRLHAYNLVGNIRGANVRMIMDAVLETAQTLAEELGAQACASAEEVIHHPEVDAVIICSPTDQHATQIRAAAQAGKAIFCEKPVALELEPTLAAMQHVAQAGVPFQIGFNRRYDRGIASIAHQLRSGAMGDIEVFRSQSSDPSPPPLSYVASSGGIFLDSAIHDLDIARFIAGEVARVTTLGRRLVEPGLEPYGDVDTSVVTLEFVSGALGIVQNSRRTHFGHDVRVEVHAEQGKLVAEQERRTPVWRYDAEGVHGDYQVNFLERFRDAYIDELQAFVHAVAEGRAPQPSGQDAIASLTLALAATRSLHEGRSVSLDEFDNNSPHTPASS